jgi:hypothetical protein
MAKTRTPQKDILSRVQDIGAEALHRLQEVPGGSKLVEMANESRSRLDEMQKRLRGLDELEKRVAKLEKQLASTSTAKKPAARKSAARKPAARKSAARKPAAKKT